MSNKLGNQLNDAFNNMVGAFSFQVVNGLDKSGVQFSVKKKGLSIGSVLT